MSQANIKQNTSYTPPNIAPTTASSKQVISDKNFNNDTVSISGKAKDLLAGYENLIHFNEKSSEVAEMLQQLRKLRETSNTMYPHVDRMKCIQIAMRIMNGDIVPLKDRRYLAENEPQMYSNALLLRQKNDNPKKYNSILEDEEADFTIDKSDPISLENTMEVQLEESGEQVT